MPVSASVILLYMETNEIREDVGEGGRCGSYHGRGREESIVSGKRGGGWSGRRKKT